MLKRRKYEATYSTRTKWNEVQGYERVFMTLHFEADDDEHAKAYATRWANYDYYQAHAYTLPYLDKKWRTGSEHTWYKHYFGSWNKESDEFSICEGWLKVRRYNWAIRKIPSDRYRRDDKLNADR